MLTHPDLLKSNIFIDNGGVPLALIDWERARLEPVALVDGIPKFLDENSQSDAFYAPAKTTLTDEEIFAHVYNYDRLAMVRGVNESAHQRVMTGIQRTKLRAVYREELERLESPLYGASNRDPQSFEQQLMRRVCWPETPGHTSATFWAVEHLGESILQESDSSQENET